MILKAFRQIMRERDVHTEDGGQAKIWEPSSDGDLFLRVQSWNAAQRHTVFDRMLGKTVKITIEILD
jgi:hypothetical protein